MKKANEWKNKTMAKVSIIMVSIELTGYLKTE